MRPKLACTIALVFLAASPAVAGVKTSVKTETYAVSGKTGEAIVRSMDRNGPRHGFLARAIAQTRYTVAWDLDWKVTDGRCRLADAAIALDIRYRYPALASSAPPALARRWASFMAGVRRHEETHGKLARQMAAAAHKAVMRVAVAGDPACRQARREVGRRVQAIYAEYEARQQAFDAREHRAGGRVDRLVGSLIGGE